MILDIARLIALKKYVGDFAQTLPPPAEKLLLPLAEVEGNIEVQGKYEIYDDDSVGVSLKISYKLKGQCSYCLEDASAEVNYSYEALFVSEGDDADNYRYDGVKLDLRPAIEDAFVFSQPEILLCGNCKASQDK